jgi:phosphatidylserine synthase
MLAQSRKVAWTMPSWGVIALTFFVAWLMISRRPMFSFKKVRVKKALVVPLLALVGLAVILTAKDPWLGAAALGGLYVASLPLSMLSYHRAMLRAGAEREHSWSAAPPLREQIREATRHAAG